MGSQKGLGRRTLGAGVGEAMGIRVSPLAVTLNVQIIFAFGAREGSSTPPHLSFLPTHPHQHRKGVLINTWLVLSSWAWPGQTSAWVSMCLGTAYTSSSQPLSLPSISQQPRPGQARPGGELLSLLGKVRPCCLLPEWPECSESSDSSPS